MDKPDKNKISTSLRTKNWEMLTSWVSIFIAMLALSLTIFEAHEHRKANRLAVMPYMSIYADLSPELDEAGIFVQNIGLGPAIILDRFIKIEDQLYRRDKGISFAAFSGLHEPWRLSDILPGSSVAPGQRTMILGFAGKDMTPDRRKLLLDLFDKIHVVIKYGSFFNESWTITSTTVASTTGEKQVNLHRSPFPIK